MSSALGTPYGNLKDPIEVHEGSVTFAELLAVQDELQAAMGHPCGHGEAGVKENLLHAIVECTEALAEVNYKPWKASREPVDAIKLATELTDVIQLVANAALAYGLTAHELSVCLRAKWLENRRRIASGQTTTGAWT